MSFVKKARFLVQHELYEVNINVDWMKVYAVQSKNGIIMKLGVIV